MSNFISDKDKKDWENFVSSNDPLSDKDQIKKNEKSFKVRSIDLHGYTLEDANNEIRETINKAYEENINKLIIITGKGLHSNNEKDPFISKELSILKHSVPDYIKKNANLMNMISEIRDAKNEDGGSGAFYILLKNKKK
ncbi:Smr/MutS family protein [Candidatus Pelagibacter sp.]|nr:Smr/MutS family protein [Candidatus Pelagibacter sp.]